MTSDLIINHPKVQKVLEGLGLGSEHISSWECFYPKSDDSGTCASLTIRFGYKSPVVKIIELRIK